MAGIADTITIDLVAQDADGTYLPLMTEDRRLEFSFSWSNAEARASRSANMDQSQNVTSRPSEAQ